MAEDNMGRRPDVSELDNNNRSNDGSEEETENENKTSNRTPNMNNSRCVLRPSALQAHASRLSFTSPKPSNNSGIGANAFTSNSPFGFVKNSGSKDENVNGNDVLPNRPNDDGSPQVFSAKNDHETTDTSENKSGASSSGDLQNRGFSDPSAANAGSSGFVFGQNMLDRVANAAEKPNAGNGTPSANGDKVELSFSPPIASTSAPSETSQQTKSLEESAQEYESKQVKRTYEEVTVITGEEEESNVIQFAAKLFAFDKVKRTWVERGRGLLRLNDREVNHVVQSRIIMRTYGSLRVIVNTQVWSGMSIQRPSDKTIRITACDSDGIKVYLVMASPKDIEQFFIALERRITDLRSSEDKSDDQQAGSYNVSVKKARLEFVSDQQREAANAALPASKNDDDE